MNISNALIETTMLGIEDHGILTTMLHLDLQDGGCQGFGGYSLDDWDAAKNRRVGTAFGTEFILRTLDTVGVGSWKDLPGKNIRIKKEGGFGSHIVAIGHIMEDKWFDPKELAKEMGL